MIIKLRYQRILANNIGSKIRNKRLGKINLITNLKIK